jgi:hypothetical protein
LLFAAPALARPVVVELFTSEGCSSCPPADAFLEELSRTRHDVLPLAFHITNWDNLGWRDPFALPEATARQRAYAPLLAAGAGVYTPQMVIDGRTDAIGSDRAAVLAAIDAARKTAAVVPITLARQDQSLVVSVAAATAGPARLLLLGYDRRHQTAVARGENAGRTLPEANIVRSITDLGAWQGSAISRSVAAPAGETYALLLQAADGRIIGAAVAGASPAS